MLESCGLAISAHQVFLCLFLQLIGRQSTKPGWAPGPVPHIWSPEIGDLTKAKPAAKEPAPKRPYVLKTYSKAASNPPVFIINTILSSASTFCFLFLSLPFYCFPVCFSGNATETQSRRPQHLLTLFYQHEFISIKASFLSQVLVFFFIPSVFNPRQIQTTISAP